MLSTMPPTHCSHASLPRHIGRIYLLFSGYVSEYLSSLAATGKSPEVAPGDEPYGVPAPGIFMTYHQSRQAMYDSTRECWLHAQLVTFAEALGKSDRVYYWAERGLEAARASGQKMVEVFLNIHMITVLLLNNDLGAALQASVGSFVLESMTMPFVIIRIAHIFLEDAMFAGRLASEAVAHCRHLIQSGAVGVLWDTAASVIEYMCVQPSLSHLRALGASQGTDVMLQAVARLGASIQAEQSLERVIAEHIAVSMFLAERAARLPAYVRTVVSSIFDGLLAARD